MNLGLAIFWIAVCLGLVLAPFFAQLPGEPDWEPRTEDP